MTVSLGFTALPGFAEVSPFTQAVAVAASQDEVIAGFQLLARSEGIIPALETAHALHALKMINFKKSDVVVVCLSGRGDKDLDTYMKHL